MGRKCRLTFPVAVRIFSGMALERTLKAARKERGWSKVELARRSGLTVQTIYLLEEARHPGSPKVETVRALAEALGRPLGELLASEDSIGVPERFSAPAPATQPAARPDAPKLGTETTVDVPSPAGTQK